MDGKSVLITGGTGSFGTAFIRHVLDNHNPLRLIVFSRDEHKQNLMRSKFDHPALRFFIGDVRDLERLRMAFRPVDIVIHAAALKHVPSGETNPIEVIKTNVMGAQNVVTAAIECGVERVIALSTDKAVEAVNLYGATKACAEKLFVAANALSGEGGTRFSVVRYGNVANSRGSVIPKFLECRAKGQSFSITDFEMTRFLMRISDAVKFVDQCLGEMQGGEIYVPKIPSVKLRHLAMIIGGAWFPAEVIGIRPGEKLHESLISVHEVRNSADLGDYYVIRSNGDWSDAEMATPLIPDDFKYTSDTNHWWLSDTEIREIVDEIESAASIAA